MCIFWGSIDQTPPFGVIFSWCEYEESLSMNTEIYFFVSVDLSVKFERKKPEDI